MALRSTTPPLDEQVFSSPVLLSSWGTPSGPTSDNILFYFAHSPFFDRTSNNATLLNQAQYNPALASVVSTRASFEAHLRSMAGLEFVVAHDPTTSAATVAAGPGAAVSGPWTIRKQIRRKDGGGGRAGEDSVDVLADYFVVGDRIFQAPTLGAVLGSRLLATAKALVTLVSKAGECAEFDPARGHVYPAFSAAAAAAAMVEGKGGAGSGSRGVTPMGEVGNGAQDGIDGDENDDYDARHEAALLAETIANSARYGREYMDEHPLVGEPGNFVIQKTNELDVPGGRKGVALPRLMVKTDLASAVGKREKGGEKSPLSPTGTGATKRRKKDRSKGQTPKEPKTPGA